MTNNTIDATEILSKNAVLSGVTISVWGASSLDRKVTKEAIEAAGAEADAGKFTKQLVPRAAVDKLAKAASEIRRLHYRMTLPWTDEGLRVLPVKNSESYHVELKRARETFDAEVEAFVSDYPRYVQEAKDRLGSMYQASDYPAPDQIRAKFSMRSRLVPIPSAADFRCTMGAEALAAAKAALEESNRQALLEATRAAWSQARVAVAAMSEKLKAYHPGAEGEKTRGIFRDSLVSNVIEVTESLPNLNLAADPRMDALAARMGDKLTYFSAAELRDDTAAREATQSEAESIVKVIDEILVTL